MWDWIQRLNELRDFPEPFALVQIVETQGSTPREAGARMLVFAGENFEGTIGGGRLEQEAMERARALIREGGSSQKLRLSLGAAVGQCCGGVVELFIEIIRHGPSLYVFGAGHVGQAVCQTLQGTPFRLHVIDDREEWITAQELPATTTRHSMPWEDFVHRAVWDEKLTHVVVMTHQHDLDQAIVEAVLRKPHRYLGLIGSDAKWRRFQDRMVMKGFSLDELKRVRCPIGIGRFGKAPKEVAISLAAELLSGLYKEKT